MMRKLIFSYLNVQETISCPVRFFSQQFKSKNIISSFWNSMPRLSECEEAGLHRLLASISSPNFIWVLGAVEASHHSTRYDPQAPLLPASLQEKTRLLGSVHSSGTFKLCMPAGDAFISFVTIKAHRLSLLIKAKPLQLKLREYFTSAYTWPSPAKRN